MTDAELNLKAAQAMGWEYRRPVGGEASDHPGWYCGQRFMREWFSPATSIADAIDFADAMVRSASICSWMIDSFCGVVFVEPAESGNRPDEMGAQSRNTARTDRARTLTKLILDAIAK